MSYHNLLNQALGRGSDSSKEAPDCGYYPSNPSETKPISALSGIDLVPFINVYGLDVDWELEVRDKVLISDIQWLTSTQIEDVYITDYNDEELHLGDCLTYPAATIEEIGRLVNQEYNGSVVKLSDGNVYWPFELVKNE